MAMAMGQFCIKQLNAHTRTRTHARPNSMVDVDVFHYWQHIVCALSRMIGTIGDFLSWQASTHAQITVLVFPFQKFDTIFQNVENRKHFRNQCLHFVVCVYVQFHFSFKFLFLLCCLIHSLALCSHFGNAT